jgi:alpha-tubulin suppressor-like RCC1 family protein
VSVAAQPISNAVAISAGGAHGLALIRDGTVVAWGGNLAGKAVGFDTPPTHTASGQVKLQGEALSNVTSIAASSCPSQFGFSIALRADGTVTCWGDNTFGQATPQRGLSNIVAVAAGYLQGLALRKDGRIVTWGQGNRAPSWLSNVVAIAAGGESGHNLALRADGTVVDWPVLSAEYLSKVPEGLTNAVAIAAGGGQCLALRRDGTVVGWGANWLGGATGEPTPLFPHEATGLVMVAGQVLTNITAVAAGKYHSLGLKSDGTLVSWGHPYAMQMSVPAGLSNVIAISAGPDFSLAITTNAAPFRLGRE